MFNASRGILYTAPPDEDGNRTPNASPDESADEAATDAPDVADIAPASSRAERLGETTADD